MPNIQEVRTAIGYKKQSALQTALVAADTWALSQTNRNIIVPAPSYESDRDDMGKGTPFAAQLFKLAMQSGGQQTARLTSEWAAMCGVFGIGLTTKAAAGVGGYKYTCSVGTTFAALEADLPSTTMVTACRQGASDVFDFALIGMAVEGFTIGLKSGIGRDTATCSVDWVGCGKYANPSTITLPAAYTEHSLNIGGAGTITLLGQNYASNARFVSCDFAWKNNIKVNKNYAPGGGTQDGFNLMNRMRRGTPEASLKCVVELVDGSTEWAAFLAGTQGTLSLIITGDEITSGNNHKLAITLHQVQFKVHEFTEDEGTIVASLDCDVQMHSSNGILTFEATCEQDDIGTAAT